MRKKKIYLVLAAAVLGAVLISTTAMGDVIKNNVAASGGVGQVRTILENQTTALDYWIQPTGGTCDAADGSTATVTINKPAGASANPGALVFSECDRPCSVTFSGPPGRYDFDAVTVTDSSGAYAVGTTAWRLIVLADGDGDGVADESDNCATAANPDQNDSNGNGIGDACDTAVLVNRAPAVATAALHANGIEGQTLSAFGSFTDADGDALSLSASPSVGTFTVSGNGSWTRTLATDDDVAQASVTVTANDGRGGSAEDSFQFSAANATPAIGSLALSRDVLGCLPSLSFTFSDPGSADTHLGSSIDWGNGSTFGFVTSPVSASGAYSTAGSYTIVVRVADDDGGSDTKTTSGYRVYNNPGSVLQPVNDTRNGQTMSYFKLGSTIPVKIRVVSCDGVAVSGLAPQVSVIKKDSIPAGIALEATSTATPTDGTAMRWDATNQQYIYNLSTKPLSIGDWTVRISDGSFAAPTEAHFSIKK